MLNSANNPRKEGEMAKQGHPGEYQYLDILRDIMANGEVRPTRAVDPETGKNVDAKTVWQRTMRFNLADGFPALTAKKLFWDVVVAELLGFLEGYENAADFRKLSCKIWDANANKNEWWLMNPYRREEDDLGRIYGVQWRKWQGSDGESVDQLKNVIEGIKNNPYSRRHIVTAYNPAELKQMALPPCHMFYHFDVTNDGKLNLFMYQRSCDMFLGVPFNIASYALLLHIVAKVTGYVPGEFVHQLGNAHVYVNHFDQVEEQLKRKLYAPPTLWLSPEITDIDGFHKIVIDAVDAGEKPSDAIRRVIRLEDYQYHPAIKAPMAL